MENTFTSILDMAGVLLPFLKWFIGGSGSKGPKVLNFLVRSPWSTIDVIGEVSFLGGRISYFTLQLDMKNRNNMVDFYRPSFSIFYIFQCSDCTSPCLILPRISG